MNLICALVLASSVAHAQVSPMGSGAIIQKPDTPAITLAPSEDGVTVQKEGAAPQPLPSSGLIVQPPSGATTSVTPSGTSTVVIQKPGDPPIVCTKIGNAVNCT